ncbi:hypothetical protein AGMMS49940_18000 [Spirochaetia bacterium]|nr:hypothetical protein AGMMS49940_18000 [Spirochaetia bacterium]
MTNLDVYNAIFESIFSMSADSFSDEFSVETAEEWDSIRQLALVAAMEDKFNIMFDPEDILEFKSYKTGKELLLKYNIDIK